MVRNLAFIFAILGLAGTGANANIVLEGFESGNLNSYSVYAGTQTLTAVSSAYAHDGSYGLGLNGTNWYVRTDAGAQLSQGESFFAYVRLGDLTGRAYLGFGSSATSTYAIALGPNTGQFIIQDDNPTTQTFTDLVDTTYSGYVANDYYKIGVTWAVGGAITAQLFDGNTGLLLTTASVVDNTITSGGISFRGFGSVADSFDTVTLVTPAVVPEPSTMLMTACGLTLSLYGLRRDRRRENP